MALKFQIDKLEDVDPALRSHYVEENGKFYLATHGEHPKISEFRQKNIDLLKNLETFKGIDPAVVAADKLKLSALEKAGERVTVLEGELATEKAARVAAQANALTTRARDMLRVSALKAGALPAALDVLLDKMEPNFSVEGDVIKAKPNIFSPTRPGEPLTPDEFLKGAMKEFAFLFALSNGGGAEGNKGSGGGSTLKPGQTLLKDPTPQQLGEFSEDIRKGKVRVEYSS